MIKDIYITTSQAAELVGGINLNSISRYCRNGLIAGAVQVNTRWLIPVAKIEDIRKIYEGKAVFR